MNRYSIPTSSLSTILKNRKNITKQMQNSFLFRNRMKMCVYKVENTVLKWMTYIRNNNLPISGSLIKENAIYFALQKLDFKHFRARRVLRIDVVFIRLRYMEVSLYNK